MVVHSQEFGLDVFDAESLVLCCVVGSRESDCRRWVVEQTRVVFNE